MISEILAFYKFIDEFLEGASIPSALFSWDGKRIKGNKEIEVAIIKVKDKNNQWFYRVKPYKDYIFIPFPVNPSVNVDYGKRLGEENPDVNYFRYVASPLAKFTRGGEENLKVNFFVFCYKPSDLMERRKKRS